MARRKRDHGAIDKGQAINIDINTDASSITPPTKKQRVNSNDDKKRLIIWYQIAPFTQEQIDNILKHTEPGNNRPLILFADVDVDNFCARLQRKKPPSTSDPSVVTVSPRRHALPNANSQLLSKHENFKDVDFLSVGIVTTFLNRKNCSTFADFARSVDENFETIRNVIDRFHVRHIIIPAKYPYPSKEQGITHALNGAGLQQKHLRYVQQKIDEIEQTCAKTFYITEVPFLVGDGENSYKSVIKKHRKTLLTPINERTASDFDINMQQNMLPTPLQPPTKNDKSCVHMDMVENAPTVPTTPVTHAHGTGASASKARYGSSEVLPDLPPSPPKRPVIRPCCPVLPPPQTPICEHDTQTVASEPSTSRTELQHYVQYLSQLVQHQQMQLLNAHQRLWHLQANAFPAAPCGTPSTDAAIVSDHSSATFSSIAIVRFVCFHVVSVLLMALLFYDPSSIFRLFWPSAYQNEDASKKISFDMYLPLIILLYGLRQQTVAKPDSEATRSTSQAGQAAETQWNERGSPLSWIHWLYHVFVAISKLFAIVAATYMVFALFADMSNVFGFDRGVNDMDGSHVLAANDNKSTTTAMMYDAFNTSANDARGGDGSGAVLGGDDDRVPTYDGFQRLMGNALLFYMTATVVWWMFGHKRAGVAWLAVVSVLSVLSFVVYFGAYAMAMFILGHHLDEDSEQMTKQEQLDVLWHFISSKLIPLFIGFGVVIPGLINLASSTSLRTIINWRTIGYSIGSALVIYCMRYYPIYTFYALLLCGFLYMVLQCTAHCTDNHHKKYTHTSTIETDVFDTPTPLAPYSAGSNPWYD